MALLRNALASGGGPLRFVGGGSGYAVVRRPGSLGDAMGLYSWAAPYSGIPDGTRVGDGYVDPLDDGGLGADIFATSSLTAGIDAAGVIASTIAGLATITAGANRGMQIGASMAGTATVTAGVNALGLLLASIKVNQVTQTDIESSVMEAVVENGLTMRQAIRLLLAVQLGKTTVSGSTATFRDTADTKDRVIGTVVGGERTSVTLDPS